MDTQAILIILLIVATGGWIGSQLFRDSGLGVYGNIVVGITGGLTGNWLLNKLGISTGTGIVGSIFIAACSAVILLAVVNLIIPRRV